MSTQAVQSRVPYADYSSVEALNISRLKEISRSPQHYLYRKDHPKETVPLKLGTAAHVATLEPERYGKQYTVWTNRTEGGTMSPRRGKVWDEFCAAHAGRTILTPDESDLSQSIAVAVRSNPLAARYLESGEPEVTLQWEIDGRPCKGRIDWLTRIDGQPVIVGLKTARDCRHFAFGSAAAKLLYHCQWAWYHDGWAAIHGGETPKVVEIVVESAAPHAVAVYRIVGDVLDQGRDDYLQMLRTLDECEKTGIWPGPVPAEEVLTLPSWALDSGEDISDLGLED